MMMMTKREGKREKDSKRETQGEEREPTARKKRRQRSVTRKPCVSLLPLPPRVWWPRPHPHPCRSQEIQDWSSAPLVRKHFPDREPVLSSFYLFPIRKKKIGSLVSGRTRRTGRFRRNLLNSDADRHGTVRPDAVRHGICLPDGAWQGIFVLDARCQGIFLLDAAMSGHFPSGRSHVRAFSFWTQPCQGIFLLDAAVSGHFPSGCSRVRAFSFWTQPCQGIFLLDAAVSGQMASGRRVSWHRGYAGCQGTEHRSKYSHRIHKHAAGSRHSDSVQFYSLYLMYIYICDYHTSRFQHKHPASHPSPLFLTRVALLSVGNKGKLANTTRRDEPDAMSMTR